MLKVELVVKKPVLIVGSRQDVTGSPPESSAGFFFYLIHPQWPPPIEVSDQYNKVMSLPTVPLTTVIICASITKFMEQIFQGVLQGFCSAHSRNDGSELPQSKLLPDHLQQDTKPKIAPLGEMWRLRCCR